MKVTPLPEVERRPRRVAVGTFDGVHVGHREVISGADTVATFEPHPAAVVAPGGAPRLLTTLERKIELIAELGVQELVVIPFDHEFAARSAQSFIDDVLVGALQAEHVSVGENFRFGHKAAGDDELLRADAAVRDARGRPARGRRRGRVLQPHPRPRARGRARCPPELVPCPPGSWTLWVASNTTGQPVSRMIARLRMSLTRLL